MRLKDFCRYMQHGELKDDQPLYLFDQYFDNEVGGGGEGEGGKRIAPVCQIGRTKRAQHVTLPPFFSCGLCLPPSRLSPGPPYSRRVHSPRILQRRPLLGMWPRKARLSMDHRRPCPKRINVPYRPKLHQRVECSHQGEEEVGHVPSWTGPARRPRQR